MFFGNSRIKLVGLIVNNKERIQQKGIQSTLLNVQSVKSHFFVRIRQF